MALAITTVALPPVVVGSAYNQTVVNSGGTGPFVWTVDSGGNFPSWASLASATGVITGTPGAVPPIVGSYTFVIRVTDSLLATATQSLTIVSGTTTIVDVANFVTVDYLNRSDIQAVAQKSALKVYRMICAKIPFDQLTQVTSEIPLTSGVDKYDLSTLVPPILGIIDIRLTINSTTKRRLRRSNPRLYDALSVVTVGQPATYARTAAQQIQFSPPPDSNNYTFRIRYWTRPTEHATPELTVLSTPLEWDSLFEWETAWWVLNATGQEQRASLLIQPMSLPRQSAPKKQPAMEIGIIPRLWNELLTTTSQKENVDEDFSVNPVMRSYSYRGR